MRFFHGLILMNTENKHTTIPIPPAQLWIGSHEHIITEVEFFLQKQFCPHGGCKACTTCRLIRERNYHAAVWFYPEKRYTLDQINPIFEISSFSLAPDQQLFFIIQKAYFLSAACSNSLLKLIEEPLPGYHFIFLAERKEFILPTIRSRCIIKTYLSKMTEHEKDQLLDFFKNKVSHNPVQFAKIVEKLRPTEQESIELFDRLFSYWMERAKKAAASKNMQHYQKAMNTISILGKAVQKLPMPGSSIIFWKNLFLQFDI